jgi:hypothetical protein
MMFHHQLILSIDFDIFPLLEIYLLSLLEIERRILGFVKGDETKKRRVNYFHDDFIDSLICCFREEWLKRDKETNFDQV